MMIMVIMTMVMAMINIYKDGENGVDYDYVDGDGGNDVSGDHRATNCQRQCLFTRGNLDVASVDVV